MAMTTIAFEAASLTKLDIKNRVEGAPVGGDLAPDVPVTLRRAI